jgi:tape measure domain-containing protein
VSTVANIAINLDSRGVPAKLKQIADRSKEVDRSLNGAANTSTRAAASFGKVGNSASGASSGLGNLAKGALKLAAAYATLNAAQSAVSAGIQRIESERRIQFLARQYGEVDQLARAAANASDRFGQSQTSANRAIADVYARLRPVGVSLENIVSVYNGFNTAARISGSTAVEAENAFRQLSQALGSGALRGDEFNSIAEQVPRILTAISQETGVAQGKLREYAADGKITADVVIGALQRIEKDGADQLAEALGGPEQAIKDFQNASEDVQVALTTAIVPEMARAFRDLAAIIVGLEPAIRYIGGLIADTLGSFRTLVESIRGGPVVERLRQGGQLGFNVGQEKEQLQSFFGKERFQQLEQQAREIGDATMTPFAEALGERLRVAIKVTDRAKEIEARQATKTPTVPTVPFKVGDTISDSTIAKGSAAAGKVKETDAERAVKIKEIRAIEVKIYEARSAGNEALALQLEAQKAQIEIQQRGLGVQEETQLLLQNGERLTERLNELEKQRLERLGQFLQGTKELVETQNDVISNYQQETNLLELQAQKGEAFVQKFKDINRLMMEGGLSFGEAFSRVEERTAAMANLNQEADLFQQALAGAGDIIGNQLRGAIDGLIDGTADWNNILRDTLSQLGSFFLNFGLNQLAGPAGSGGILSFLGFGTRANGGPVNANQPYIVGERGPELFVPFQQGSITSNEAMQQASMAQLPFTRNAESISQATQTAQAMQAAGPINVKYESTVINGMTYVTEDQHRRGMAQAAERGRALTLQALQNSPRTRSKVGI